MCLPVQPVRLLIIRTEIDYIFLILYRILHGLIRPAAVSLHAEDHKIGAVNHFPVAYLHGTLRMCACGVLRDFHIVIIVQIIFLMVAVLCRHVGQQDGPLEVNIIQDCNDITVEAGETASFSLAVSGGKAPYTFSWLEAYGQTWRVFRDSSVCNGQGTDTMNITPNSVGTKKYRCVVKDSAGNTVTTETVSVTVKPLAAFY